MSKKDWLQFWIVGFIWGTSFLWIKIAVSEISPAVLVTFRALFGALGLLLFLLARKNTALNWKAIRPYLGVFTVIGLFNVAIPNTLISWSEQYIESGLASILNSTMPLFTILLAPLFLADDGFSQPKLLGLLVGFTGVVILFLPSLTRGMNINLLALACMLLAALSYAGAGIFTRLKARGVPSQIQAFMQLIMATFMMVIFTLSTQRPLVLPHTPLTWFALLWLGLLGYSLAYLFYFSLIGSIGPTRTSLVTYVPPLVGVLLGTIFLGERLSFVELLGGLMIVSGIAVVNWKPSQAKTIPQTKTPSIESPPQKSA